MKYSIFIVALCLGLALARPGKSGAGRPGGPGKPGPGSSSEEDNDAAGEAEKAVQLPTEVEYQALEKFGSAMKHLAALAYEQPEAIISLLDAIGSAMPEDGPSEAIEAKRSLAKRRGKGSSEESEDDMIEQQIKEVGVYKAFIGKAFVDGVVMEKMRLAVEHGIASHMCKVTEQTCPDPIDWPGIIETEIAAFEEAGQDELAKRKRSNSKRELVAKLLALLEQK